jgi:hypothetical protein
MEPQSLAIVGTMAEFPQSESDGNPHFVVLRVLCG